MQKKVLVLVSNPEETGHLNLPSELRRLQESVQRSQKRASFTVALRFAAKQIDLRRHILDIKPQIIHFCGHGTAQGLILEDETGKAKVALNEVLIDLLRAFADRVECVLLNACDSENLANGLVQHLNYVIGMNQEVRDDSAIAFAEGFYDALGAGESYERAFEIGKNAVLGQADSHNAPNRKLTVASEDDEPVIDQIQEHLIPVLKINPHPTPIKPLWLDPEMERQAVRDLLEAIAGSFNTIKLFHTDEPIVLKDQYIPVQVTLERRYKYSLEKIGGYAESEAELRQIYAMKGSSEAEIQEEIQRQQVDWEEARRQHSRLVVLADPGMGKSTLLQREVVTSVQQTDQTLAEGRPIDDITIPLLIRLSSLADEMDSMPVSEAILKIIKERHSTLLKHHENLEVVAFLNGFLQQQLLKGKALLLLDALDEVPDGKRQKLLEKLNEFSKDNQTCPMVGTSRIVGYGGRLVDGAKDVEIVPFTQKQTEQYIETWFTNAQKSFKDQSISARNLIKALRERPQLAGLAQNPLLLSLICSLYQHDHLTLPARRSQIYEQAVNCMLREWNRTRPGFAADRTTAKIRLLEALAYHFTTQGQEVFDYEDLYDWVESYLEEGDAPRDLRDDKTGELIAELTEDDGILQKLYQDRNDDQYLFLHRTFQEYFTASYLKRKIKKNKQNPVYVTELVQNYCWNYDWHETLPLLAGLMENPVVLLEAILAEKDDIFQTQLLLAGRCLVECRELSHSLVGEMIERIYQFWLAHPNAEFIRSVTEEIGQTWINLVQKLQIALNHWDINVRWNAAAALGQIGTHEAIDALIAALNHGDLYVRRSAAAALGQIGTDRAMDTLITMLDDEDNFVRWNIAKALGQIGTDRAMDMLITMLDDEDNFVKVNVVEVLGQIGTISAIDALITLLNSDDSFVRLNVAKVLGQIGTDRAVDALITTLNHEDSVVGGTAAAGLGRIGTDQALSALITALNHEDSVVRVNAAVGLGWNGTDKAIEVLITALTHEDSVVRGGAAAALGQIGTNSAVDVLITALNDEDSVVRCDAAAALGEIGQGEAVDALITALKDEDSDVRGNAAWALGEIGKGEAVDALITALKDEDFDVRGDVVEALGKIGKGEAVDALIALLKAEDSYLRRSVVVSLGQIGSDRAMEALISALNDEDNNVRDHAVWALGQIGSDRAMEVLIIALNHEDGEVRGAVVEALGQIATDRAMSTLINVLNDEDSLVRQKAAEALGQIGEPLCLEKLLQSGDRNLIEREDVFLLARSWAIRFSQKGLPFIPVYPEWVGHAGTSTSRTKGA